MAQFTTTAWTPCAVRGANVSPPVITVQADDRIDVAFNWTYPASGRWEFVQLEIRNNETGAVNRFTQSPAGLAHVFTNLDPSTQYSFQVFLIVENCTDDDVFDQAELPSNVQTFFTPPRSPRLLEPVANCNTCTVPGVKSMLFKWEQLPGRHEGFTVNVSANATFANNQWALHPPMATPMQDNDIPDRTITSFNVNDLLDGHYYHYQVRSYNNENGNFVSSPWKSGSNPIATKPVQPVNVVASNVFKTTFSTAWNSSTNGNATNFKVDVSLSNTFTNPVTKDVARIAGTQNYTTNMSGLARGNLYFGRVRAVTSSGEAASDIFRIITRPTVTVADQVTSAGFDANWNTGSGVVNYLIDVATDAQFNAVVQANIAATGNKKTITNLVAGSSYYYRVRGVNGVTTSVPSDSSFTITRPAAKPATFTTGTESTAFTAHWDAGNRIDSYRLEVSKSANFATLERNYTGIASNVVSKVVDNLTAGTTYFYRVRAVKTSALTSEPSAHVEVVTAPGAPVATTPADITTTGFLATWQAQAGATRYTLSIFGNADQQLKKEYTDIQATSQVVTDLSPGLEYYYRVKALNAAGTSGYSNSITVKTVSPAPQVKQAVNILTSSFIPRWDPAQGAERYFLDVATQSDFSLQSILADYNNRSVELNNSDPVVTGLSPASDYYYRLRAGNTGGTSANSTVVAVRTLALAPANVQAPADERQPRSIKVKWDVVPTATHYLLEVSTQLNFETLLEGYNPKEIPQEMNVIREIIIEDLLPGTVYYMRMKTRNVSGISELYSEVVAQKTLESNGSGNEFRISSPPQFNGFDPQFKDIAGVYKDGATNNLDVGFSDGIGNVEVSFFHRRNSDAGFVSEPVTSATTTYTVSIDKLWLDEFGMQFYFEASDFSRKVLRTPVKTVYASAPLKIPVKSFGKDISNYQVISFPYQPVETRIRDLFEEVLGAYDPHKWRFLKYVNGEHKDFSDGVASEHIQQGHGYWFISAVERTELDFKTGASFGNHRDEPFTMRLNKGWNLVGNPFPYDVSWAKVLEANPGLPPELNEFWIYSKNVGEPFIVADNLEAYGGGFVFTGNEVDITFPLTLKDNDSGRKPRAELTSILPADSWLLPVQLIQGELLNNRTAIGMAANASDGKDNYDLVSAPRFMRFVELSSTIDAFDYNIGQNVVGKKDRHEWRYRIESSEYIPVTLRWDRNVVPGAGASLVLYDKANGTVVNMAKVSEYTTSPSASICFYYSSSGSKETESVTHLNVPHPNPFHSEVRIPIDYSLSYHCLATIEISDITGRTIYTGESLTGGDLKEIVWNGMTSDGHEVPQGIYFYSIHSSCKNETVLTGKLIKH